MSQTNRQGFAESNIFELLERGSRQLKERPIRACCSPFCPLSAEAGPFRKSFFLKASDTVALEPPVVVATLRCGGLFDGVFEKAEAHDQTAVRLL